LEGEAVQSQTPAGIDEALGADDHARELLQSEQVHIAGDRGGVQQAELGQGDRIPAAAGAGRRARRQAVRVQATHGEDFQVEQLGSVTLAEAQLGAAALEASYAFGLELLERLSLHQQYPGNGHHERAEATQAPAHERTKLRPRSHHGSWR
jgi:hypothetical protein